MTKTSHVPDLIYPIFSNCPSVTLCVRPLHNSQKNNFYLSGRFYFGVPLSIHLCNDPQALCNDILLKSRQGVPKNVFNTHVLSVTHLSVHYDTQNLEY